MGSWHWTQLNSHATPRLRHVSFPIQINYESGTRDYLLQLIIFGHQSSLLATKNHTVRPAVCSARIGYSKEEGIQLFIPCLIDMIMTSARFRIFREFCKAKKDDRGIVLLPYNGCHISFPLY